MSDNKKIKMILNGALGRMGSYVLDAVSDTNDIEIMHGVDPSVTSSTNSYKGVNVVLNLNQDYLLLVFYGGEQLLQNTKKVFILFTLY